MAVHVPLSFEAQADARLLMFSHMNLLSLAIGDPISVPTQDIIMGLYVLTIGNRRGICTNRYNSCNHKNYQNEIVDENDYKYTKEKEPYFCCSYDALGTYRQKQINLYSPLWQINLYSPLWLWWQLDQCVIASINREVPIEVQYESLPATYRLVTVTVKARALLIVTQCDMSEPTSTSSCS
ncbi:hypothetical protein AMTRI_Chr11g150850 [Amborella trichopoda]